MEIKKEYQLLLGALLLASPLAVSADDGQATHQIGIASYASAVEYDFSSYEDSYSGGGIFYTGAVNDNVALRVGLFSGDYDGNDPWLYDSEASGHEVSLLLGGNLKNEGFKGYLGLGIFSEEWDGTFINETFSGAQLGFGIGYNVKVVAFDLWVNVRNASDYEDFWGLSAAAASSGLMVSARF